MKYPPKIVAALTLTLWAFQGVAQTQINWFTFSKDYYPGTYDINIQYLGGTDLMYLVNHKGKLWAGTSVWNDNPGTDPTPGPQILVKENSTSYWKVDTSMGTGFLRTDALYSFVFTRNKFGNLLPQPDTLLMASFSDLTAPYEVCVWVRNDATGEWIKTVVYPNVSSAEASYIRHMNVYTDKTTGVQHIFAAGITAVVRGAYDSSTPGKLEWQAIEITGPQRMLSSAVCNGDYYIAFATDGDTTNNNCGIFRRNDGKNPTWSFVYEWPDTGNINLGRNYRGMTAVNDPNGGNHQVLVGIVENLRSALLVDPINNTQNVEVNWQDFFQSKWGPAITAFNYAAYNNTVSIIAPDNGDSCLLMGAWVTYPDAYGTINRNNSWYLVRRPDGTWHYGQVIDLLNPIPPLNGLGATRTIVKSPFQDEPYVYYFGGKDAGGTRPIYHNSAWIYKGIVNDPPTGVDDLNNTLAEFSIYPNPAANQLEIMNLPNNFSGTVTIFNILGQVVFSRQKTGSHFNLEVGGLHRGIYLLRLRDKSGKIFIQKFIKK